MRCLRFFPYLILALGWASLSAAAEKPEEFVAAIIREAKAVVENDSMTYEEKRRRLSLIIRPRLDEAELARRALGRHWQRNRERMAEFKPLFIALLEEKFLVRHVFENLRGAEVDIMPARNEGRYAEVVVKIRNRVGREVSVGSRLIATGGSWKAYDLTVEGVSAVLNYRTQFDRILSQPDASFDDLLAKIREKLARAEAKNAKSQNRR